MNKRDSIIIGAVVVLGAAIVTAVAIAAPPNTGFKDAAAILAIVTAAAVGIERILELLWTLVNESGGQWWPANRLLERVKQLETDAAEAVGPVFDRASDAIAAAEKNVAIANALVSTLNAERAKFVDGIAELQAMAPTNQRTELVATLALQGVSLAKKTAERYSADVTLAASIAHQSITGAADFLATLKENPGRKMLSIYLGSVLGILVSSFLGLDMFAAGLAADSSSPDGTTLGVILTGLVIGLGANPTHTVIGLLQEIQQSRRLQSVALPSISYGASASATATAPTPSQAVRVAAEQAVASLGRAMGDRGFDVKVFPDPPGAPPQDHPETVVVSSWAPSPPDSLMLRR